MVERKKTGLAKARKRVSPINHFLTQVLSHVLCQTVHLGQTLKREGNFVGFHSLQYCVHWYMWNLEIIKNQI